MFGSVGTVVGITLVVVPVVIYQWDNRYPPLGYDWSWYPFLCVVLGAIGGLLMVPTTSTSTSTTATMGAGGSSTAAREETVVVQDLESNHSSHSETSCPTFTQNQKWFNNCPYLQRCCSCCCCCCQSCCSGGGQRRRRRGGFRWVGGMLGGGLASSAAYFASWKISQTVNIDIVDVPLILVCAVPGIVVYALVHQCSDYAFPPPLSSSPYHPRHFDYDLIPPAVNNEAQQISSTDGINTIRISNHSRNGSNRSNSIRNNLIQTSSNRSTHNNFNVYSYNTSTTILKKSNNNNNGNKEKIKRKSKIRALNSSVSSLSSSSSPPPQPQLQSSTSRFVVPANRSPRKVSSTTPLLSRTP